MPVCCPFGPLRVCVVQSSHRSKGLPISVVDGRTFDDLRSCQALHTLPKYGKTAPRRWGLHYMHRSRQRRRGAMAIWDCDSVDWPRVIEIPSEDAILLECPSQRSLKGNRTYCLPLPGSYRLPLTSFQIADMTFCEFQNRSTQLLKPYTRELSPKRAP